MQREQEGVSVPTEYLASGGSISDKKKSEQGAFFLSEVLRGRAKPVGIAPLLVLKDAACDVRDHDIARDNDPDEYDQRREIEGPSIGQDATDRCVDWLKEPIEPLPDRSNDRLAEVQDVEVDKPAHDDVNDHDEEGHVEQQPQDLENGDQHDSGVLLFCCIQIGGQGVNAKGIAFPRLVSLGPPEGERS